MVESARRGEQKPPADMRFLLRGVPTRGSKQYGNSRARVVTFLRGVYESIAETLPDVRDDPRDDSNVEFGAIRLDVAEEDPYSEAAALQAVPAAPRARKTKSSCVMNQDHKDEERFLPPGHMRDYWLQLVAAESSSERAESLPAVPFGTFWKIWYEEFSFLKFRHASSTYTVRYMCAPQTVVERNVRIHQRKAGTTETIFKASTLAVRRPTSILGGTCLQSPTIPCRSMFDTGWHGPAKVSVPSCR